MNILIVTGPRTAGTYFIEKFLPNQYLGEIGEQFHGRAVSKLYSAVDDRVYYNHNEMFDFSKQSLHSMQHIDGVSSDDDRSITPQAYEKQCFDYWQTAHTNPKDIHALKLFRNHFHSKKPLEFAMCIKRILKSTDKQYVLYRKDMTAVIYSLYYAFFTKRYHVRDSKDNQAIDISHEGWRRLEQSVLLNYEFMLNFAKKHDAEIVCTEDDLPHLPYSTYHSFTDNSLVCDKSEYFHEQFQMLKD